MTTTDPSPTAPGADLADPHGADQLLARILNCLPAGTFELETFIGLVGVEVTDRVPTASVTCGARSRLRLNPTFVSAHCRTDEHLFLLVMHELWHVLLAHTRLYPRPTLAHNIAFDAVINAGLARQFAGREYRGFFEELYSADCFPERLLRPPEGWPFRPVYTGPGPRGTEEVLRGLYPARGRPSTYWADVVELLRRAEAAAPQLLGDHEADDQRYSSVARDEASGGALADMVGGWSEEFRNELGPGAGGVLADQRLGPVTDNPVRREFEEVLRRSCRPDPGGTPQVRVVEEPVPSVSVLPHRRDRRRVARARLGVPTLLHQRPVTVPTRRTGPPVAARVYVDVSGSMTPYLPDLLGPLATVVRQRLATLWQFSTQVVPLPLATLREGRILSTGGTDLDCVLEHALGDPRTSCIVIVSDGFVLDPPEELVTELVRRGVVVESVVPPTGDTGPLGQLGTVTVLPSIAAVPQ